MARRRGWAARRLLVGRGLASALLLLAAALTLAALASWLASITPRPAEDLLWDKVVTWSQLRGPAGVPSRSWRIVGMTGQGDQVWAAGGFSGMA